MSKTKQIVFTGLCIALGVILPVALHSVPNAGSVLLPMHIPVLLCGLACSWQYGLACGILTPLVSSLITGMPPAPYLPPMVFELAVYGLAASLLLKWVRTSKPAANVYIALTGSMLIGRVVYGAAKALIFSVGNYSVQVWMTSAFVTALPGIIIQLLLIPMLLGILTKAHVLPSRYASAAA